MRRARAAHTTAVTGWGLAAVLLLAACSSPAPMPRIEEPVVVPPTIEAAKAAAPAPVIPVTWPLTGVAGEPAARPALAVKIENTAVARPQAGLEQADVVWETIVEFDVSRFVAVFHSQTPGEVGPIRSVRPMDPLIVAPLHGLLAYSGGQPGILDEVVASGVQSLSHDRGVAGMYRVSARSAPHNVYGNPQAFWDQVDGEHQAAPQEQFDFARSPERASAVTGGTPAAPLAFRLSAASSPSWTWDGTAWLRSEGSNPATAASGARLSATNVVAITADHPDTGYGAQGGAAVPTYSLVGSGDAVVATGGQTIAARWQKDAPDAPLRLVTADGASVTLAPGNTWVELIPAGKGSLTVS
ncbi:DUF3048 domain-containing protein [Cellulomonas timonensis]|uniref:DUF3048 domain-containing protein n=1 Tax=Cellulomonas timonensis TaxID=1689271 RepID=UPI0008349467|nr:DUF3048 domain-containing protein [Cellulomonas timonensis]